MYLDKIVRHKLAEIERFKKKNNHKFLLKVALLPHGGPKNVFCRALKKARVPIIAEIKRKSPSKGLLRRSFDAVLLAKEYERCGASALSILTDNKYFGGSSAILKKIHTFTKLPILRKDFILDPYQVYESKQIGADAILLIAAILTPRKLALLTDVARRLGLDILYEVHNRRDLKKVLPLKPKMIGINNRNLKTFHVNLSVTENLAKRIPRGILVVSESGIATHADIKRLKKSGAKAFLVGETLVRDKEPGAMLKRLMGEIHDTR